MSNELDVKRVLETYARAVWDQDVPLFLSIYANDVQVFDAWGRWEYRGVDEWKAMPPDWFGFLKEENARVRVTFENLRVFAGDDVAAIHAEVRYANIAEDGKGEETRHIINRLSAGLVKEKGTWKIVHEHTSVPVDMRTQKPMKKE